MKLDKIMSNCLPYCTRGKVVKGFGRGSKELEIPTANFPEAVVESLPTELPTGIYYGWAQLDGGEVHKMVMSVGWNPYYHNEKKSMETHIMHDFQRDFYNSILSVMMLGYIRGEENFPSLDDLKNAIHNDISIAKYELDKDSMLKYKRDDYFTNPNSNQNGNNSSINSTL